MIRKHYVDSSFGQIHARSADSSGEEIAAPLICLHPAPYSGMYFTTAMPLLNSGRRVIALDYPGYGGSDSTSRARTIADYAAAMTEALQALSPSGPVDLLGFHTGSLVAAEIMHQSPESVRRSILCDIPFFTAEQQSALREKMTSPLPVTAELESLSGAWAFDVAKRLDDMALPRAFELFIEHMRTGTKDFVAFAAAFSYDCEARFSTLSGDVICMATQSGLHEATQAAASTIPATTFIDVPEVTSAVFETGAEAISKRILTSLDDNA